MRALFGGSFNPVHVGHLILARDVLEDFKLDEVIFVPANLQPLKGELSIPPEVRLEALKAAVSLEPRFRVWDYEIRKGGVSYTYQTLQAFWELYGEKPFFVMGVDSFNTLPLWKEPLRILELADLIVLSRPGFTPEVERVKEELGVNFTVGRFKRGKVKGELPQVSIYEGRLIEVSSTEVRKRLKSGLPISYLVPERVNEILRRWRDAT
ncbi:nicotinate-nucleotide adenylyltransferase [Thermovibrio guaymasensis]|uniref:Probable nicotinate-nucleotide adenylyltransferase n=1 Tax=Thermovibrio guaymasensis TaxID=240167 RepID=A0A420W7M2_9BACT|nr:nicotinate-nucleotide adenylyltransferase [Thermovibrio guaymasensis]RKQ63317.1 nicotinate-nucleotide adenylyltransferase [Thermovibrio guaymasensis]